MVSYEDFTTYTETDPNSHIEKTEYHIDFNCYRNEDAYLYKDYGADYFGSSWEHKVDFRITEDMQDNDIYVIWALSNDIDDINGLRAGNKTCLWARAMRVSGVNRISLLEVYNGSGYEDYYTTLTVNTWYYLTIKKTSTAFECKIYSDWERTNLLDTLTLTLHGDWKFRYVFGANTYNSAGAYNVNGDTEYLIFGTYTLTTHRYHNFFTRLLMRPRGWAKKEVGGTQTIVRRPYVPYQPQQPLKES